MLLKDKFKKFYTAIFNHWIMSFIIKGEKRFYELMRDIHHSRFDKTFLFLKNNYSSPINTIKKINNVQNNVISLIDLNTCQFFFIQWS